ncbi:MAG TPA: hypothetical protein ENG45_00290 [Candidatus Aenigmarchaeota archaeon]|nr:hypothetical protein [Candidatus Aenigmarchaeota archaeon]
MKLLRKIFLRAFNRNQILILQQATNGFVSMNALIEFLSWKFGVPKSTLKLNSRILRDLHLIEFGKGQKVCLTQIGKFIVNTLQMCDNSFFFRKVIK